MAESEEEVDVLVQRVVKDINNAFKKNPNIDEIGLIPCPEARYNRSPIVLVENSLGVESWCVKFLLPYVHNKLLLYRQRKQQKRSPQRSQRSAEIHSHQKQHAPVSGEDEGLSSECRAEALVHVDPATSLVHVEHPCSLVDITCTLLLLNPDFTTAWNVRKELVQCGVLNPERDLYLGKLALTKFPQKPGDVDPQALGPAAGPA
ncbi:hypothetical protein ANANG_G00197530 [Anguilla anguilla]|uniref:Uncharacterized protein n=1 Tax=Anguilla anguilla TaxID=7936 RepID=A0A9D3M5R4_ANGAN|nr:hypothetical protein ANANG_G00197530 [Anguilla anguilla]